MGTSAEGGGIGISIGRLLMGMGVVINGILPEGKWVLLRVYLRVLIQGGNVVYYHNYNMYKGALTIVI